MNHDIFSANTHISELWQFLSAKHSQLTEA